VCALNNRKPSSILLICCSIESLFPNQISNKRNGSQTNKQTKKNAVQVDQDPSQI
jgi:hypothetical protein